MSVEFKNAGFAALAYQQIGVKYAFVVQERRKDYFKIGFGLDYNIGLAGSYARISDASYTLSGIDTINIRKSELEMAYTDPYYYTDSRRRLNDFFGESKLGNGIGINAGFVYEHRPKYQRL